MAAKSVDALLEDIRFVDEENFAIVQAVRALIRKKFGSLVEEVKYGGILYSSDVQCYGIFSYTAHVSVEFGNGANINDEYGFLEGKGKGRRHIKLRSLDDIKSKKLAHYLPLAMQAANQAQP